MELTTKGHQPVVGDVLGVDLLVAFLPHVLFQNVPGLEGLLTVDASLQEELLFSAGFIFGVIIHKTEQTFITIIVKMLTFKRA